MTTVFEINAYTKSGIWKGNDKLVQPDGSKRCDICGKKKYSCEFAEFDSFIDGKVPVCSKCARGHKKREKIIKLLPNVVIECKQCKQEKSIGYFIGRSSDWYKVVQLCSECRSSNINQ